MTNMNVKTSGSRQITHIQSVSTQYEIDVILFDEDDEPVNATVGVTHFISQPGFSWADNPDDYYGYTEIEYDVFDEEGYKNDELAAFVTSRVEDYIIEQCMEIAKSEAEDRAYDEYISRMDYEDARFSY